MRFEKNARLELSRAKQEYEAVLEKLKSEKDISDEEKQREKERCMEEAYKNIISIMK